MGTSATPLHDRVREVTERIRDRSAPSRADYLAGVAGGSGRGVARERLACTNLAHGFAAAEVSDKDALKRLRYPNVGIVSAYNGMLRALAGPFPDVVFCPTGGISRETAPSFLALPNVACVGGSWVAPPDCVAAGDWDAIEMLAREAVALRPVR